MTDLSTYKHISFTKRWDLAPNTTYMLGQCAAIIQAIAIMPLKPQYRKELLKLSLRKGARATTAIEGNTLSEEDICRIDAGEKLPPSKQYMQTEVENILAAFNAIRKEVVLDDKSTVITPELIERFHAYVGKNLGDHFQSVPGKFRASGHNVVVGTYRPPDGAAVRELMVRLCDWMKSEFRYEAGRQSFDQQVLQAIVFHVYIAWIHPFGDGNGRTARLIEFYILLRAGLPDIASHILSNFYNETREEYYRQLDTATRENSLSSFIKYAVTGFRDGLVDVLNIVQANLLETSWHNFIYEMLDSKKASGKTKAIVKRRRSLGLNFPTDKFYTLDEVMNTVAPITREYARHSPVTLRRDIAELERLEIIVSSGPKFKGNMGILKGLMPMRKGI